MPALVGSIHPGLYILTGAPAGQETRGGLWKSTPQTRPAPSPAAMSTYNLWMNVSAKILFIHTHWIKSAHVRGGLVEKILCCPQASPHPVHKTRRVVHK